MNQNPGIIGKKIGMTQIFTENGEVLRVTVVQAGCVVVGKRTLEKDGYSALILGLNDRKEKHTNKPLAGYYKAAGVSPKRHLRELRCPPEHAAKFEVGGVLKVEDVFETGQYVDAQSRTRGRGFSGVIRRWSMAGSVGSHGTHEYFRHGGSIGTNMTPGRTLPGRRWCSRWLMSTGSALSSRRSWGSVSRKELRWWPAADGPRSARRR